MTTADLLALLERAGHKLTYEQVRTWVVAQSVRNALQTFHGGSAFDPDNPAEVLPADRQRRRGGPAGTRAGLRRPSAFPGPPGPPGPGEPGMREERRLLRIGEYLIARACRHLPAGARDERYREWVAELPAILRDPGVRSAARRAARMLRYASGSRRR